MVSTKGEVGVYARYTALGGGGCESGRGVKGGAAPISASLSLGRERVCLRCWRREWR
jgi:hypothetical protein